MGIKSEANFELQQLVINCFNNMDLKKCSIKPFTLYI